MAMIEMKGCQSMARERSPQAGPVLAIKRQLAPKPSVPHRRYRHPGDLVSMIIRYDNVVTAVSLAVGGKFAGELCGF